MRKSKILLIFCGIIAVFISSAAGKHCQLKDSYAKCYETYSCDDNLDSYIVAMLAECGSSKEQACEDFFRVATSHFFDYKLTINHLEWSKTMYASRIGVDIKQEDYNAYIINLATVMREFLRKCESKMGRYRLQIPPFLDDLQKIEHWPNWELALEQEDWQQRDFDWLNALAALRTYGLNNVFFKEQVALAHNDPNKLIVELTIPDEVRDFETASLVFQNCQLVDIITNKLTNLIKKMEQLDNIAMTLRQKHLNESIFPVEKKQILTLSQLEKQIPLINWQKYFSILLKRPLNADTFEIQLRNPSYLQDIATTIHQTDKKVVAFYVLLQFLYSAWEDTNVSVEENLVNNFAFGANYFYNRVIQKEFGEYERSLNQIFEALKEQFSITLRKNKYQLSELALRDLEEKLQKLKLRIGNSPLEMPAEFYDKFYAAVNLTEDISFVGAVQETLRMRFTKEHERLFKTPSQVELDYNFAYQSNFKQKIEPFYVPQRHFIVVPQQFLRPPFTMPQIHKIFKYATTGFGIARALMEVFMPEGIIYDAAGQESDVNHGMFLNIDYQADLRCIRKVSEDVENRYPDIPALQLVIDTFYQEIASTTQESLHLQLSEVMDKTHDLRDLFFRYLGQYFRGYSNLPAAFDVHDRFNDLLANIPQFAELYNCNVTKTEICSLW